MAATPITVRLLQDESLSQLKRNVDPYLGQDYRTLLQECLQKKCLFEDPNFPANPTSLGYNQLGPWSPKTRGIQWKRPQDEVKLHFTPEIFSPVVKINLMNNPNSWMQ